MDSPESKENVRKVSTGLALTNEWFILVDEKHIKAYPTKGIEHGVMENPEKIFDIDQTCWISSAGNIRDICLDNQDKPWRKPTTLAGLQESGGGDDDPDFTPTCLRITLWDFETCTLLQHIPMQDPFKTKLDFYTFVDDMFFVFNRGGIFPPQDSVGQRTALRPWELHRSGASKNPKSYGDPSHCFFREKKGVHPDWQMGTFDSQGHDGRKIKEICPQHYNKSPYDDDWDCEKCETIEEDNPYDEEIIHVIERDNIVYIVTHYQIYHFKRMPERMLDYIKTETMYKRQRYLGEGADGEDCYTFYEHLALDYSLTFAQNYTLRDITKSIHNQHQVIWTCPDPQNGSYLFLNFSSFQMRGLTANFDLPDFDDGPPVAPYDDTQNKRVFLSMSLQDVVASPNFVNAVKSIIKKSPTKDFDPEIPLPTVIGVPLHECSIYGTSSYLAVSIYQRKPNARGIDKYEESVTFIDMNCSLRLKDNQQPAQSTFRCHYAI